MSSGIRTTVWLLAATGLVARLAPFLDPGGRLLRQFPTEDGYLMLTIARNIALGHGMSTADGTIPTNGTQPLATYLWAACFWLVDAAKAPGVALVLAVELAISCVTAVMLYRLAVRVLHARECGRSIAAFAAAAWFASPLSVSHTMNCLESGLYVLTIVSVLLALLPRPGEQSAESALGRWSLVGLLLGVAFWARNDAVLLCGAIGSSHLISGLPMWRLSWTKRLSELSVAGTMTLLVAAPWLIQNLLRFESIVPVSGRAESLHVTPAESLSRIPAAMVEYLTVVGQIPSDLERHGLVILASIVLIVAVAVTLALASRAWFPEERTVVTIGLSFTLFLVFFYGLFFGADHFISRYLFPTSPFLALLMAGVVLTKWQRIRGDLSWFVGVACSTIVVLAIGLNLRIYVRGAQHSHFQMVEWVESNVPRSTWVGAIQSGTLGFFHDRTINLDGKVNPEALRARAQNGIPEYVLQKQIPFLVDWVGIADWAHPSVLAPHYEVLLRDEARNLAVLKRANDAPGLGYLPGENPRPPREEDRAAIRPGDTRRI